MNQSQPHVIEPVKLEMPMELLSSCNAASVRADHNKLVFVLNSPDEVRKTSKSGSIVLHAHAGATVPLRELVVHVDSQDAVDTQELKDLGDVR